MLADLKIQEMWRRMLATRNPGRDIQVGKIEEGYYAVVASGKVEQAPEMLCGMSDYQLLETRIPHLDRTRAVYLNAGSAYQLSDVEPFEHWAGSLAAQVESGATRAFAVVDMQVFVERVQVEFVGWSVERAGQNLVVSDGRFKVRLNLLRSVVRMVLSRSSIAEAIRSLHEEVQAQLAFTQGLFRRFERRFENYSPSVLDHYFTAYADLSCVATGWDYWQVAGKTPAEAERIFEGAMREFRAFLEAPSESGLAWLGAADCGRA